MKELASSFRNNSGLGITQVMMGAGLASLVMLSMAQISQMSTRSIKSNTLTNDFNQLVNSVQLALNDEKLCRTALSAGRGSVRLNPNEDFPRSLNQIQIRGADGTTVTKVAAVNSDPQANGLLVRKIEITGPVSAPEEIKPGYKKQLVNLRLEAEKVMGRGLAGDSTNTAMGKQHYQKDFVLAVVTDENHYIRNCYSESSPTEVAEEAAEKACDEMLGHYDPAKEPACQLEQAWILDSVTRAFRAQRNNSYVNGFPISMAFKDENLKRMALPRYRVVARRAVSLESGYRQVEEIPVDQLYIKYKNPTTGADEYAPAFELNLMKQYLTQNEPVTLGLLVNVVLPDGNLYAYSPNWLLPPATASNAMDQWVYDKSRLASKYTRLDPNEGWEFVAYIGIGRRPLNLVTGLSNSPSAHFEEAPPH